MAVVLFLGGVAAARAWEVVKEEGVEPEALTWIREMCPPDFFGVQTQLSRRGAERLVRRLYDRGALDVTMVRVLDAFAGFRVFLPLAPERRRALIELVNKRFLECGFAPVKDKGQESVVLWFC